MRDKSDLARNLQYLSSHYRSVAEVCRRIGINRQQFNKYLGGSTTPSIHNLNRIADFFGVDESEVLLPHEDFVKIVMRRPATLELSDPLRQFLHGLRPTLTDSAAALERYCGFYHAYFQSPAWPNGVLCSLYALTNDGKLTYVKSVERLAWAHRANRQPFVQKYLGLALLDGNRIYLGEAQPSLTSTYSLTILYPSNRSRIQTLNGLVISVTGGANRAPFATRTTFERIGDKADFRAALARCGIYRSDSDAIDPDIKDRLDNSVATPWSVLTANEF